MEIVMIYNTFTVTQRPSAHLCEPPRNSYYAEARGGTQRFAEKYKYKPLNHKL